ncbi:MAG: hypothetical protein IJ358_01460 [Clostridia bacterium]|nr:hypothetical protein [Clostridia bacterium]
MRVIDKVNSINEIVDTVLQKARYQKVILCLDDESDMDFVDKLASEIHQNVVLLKYYYNKNNVSSFFDMANSGARVIIYNVSSEHFYQLQNDNNFILNIFVPQSNFVLPYISNVESLYGDNLLVCNLQSKDYISLAFMYDLALNKLWGLLLQKAEVDVTMFKQIDALANSKDDFYIALVNQVAYLKSCLGADYKQIAENQMPYYIYLRLCTILKMLESLNQNKEEYIDFYKAQLTSEEVDKAHALIVKYDIVDLIKFNSGNLIKITSAILNRLKIIIKKYFNFNNIKLNKLNKIIKNQSKLLNIDNLLYISYIFNAI